LSTQLKYNKIMRY